MRNAEALPPSVIAGLGVAAVVGGAVAAGALLLAPLETIHATPRPSIDFTTAPDPGLNPGLASLPNARTGGTS